MYLYKYDTQSYINQLRSLVLIKTVFRERQRERERERGGGGWVLDNSKGNFFLT